MAEVQAGSDALSTEAREQLLKDLIDVKLTPETDLVLLYDTVSHCAEPGDNDAILEKLKTGIDIKDEDPPTVAPDATTFTIKFDERGVPVRPANWPESFQLVLNEEEKSFTVLHSKDETPNEDDKPYHTEIDENDHELRSGEFGYRYNYGSKAQDYNKNPLGQANKQIEFNYAEHRRLGEELVLKFPDNKTRKGLETLELPNKVKLTYGEINGLGGDFFGTSHPVCTGKNFEQQCDYFMEAYNTLGKSDKAVRVVGWLKNTRAGEVKDLDDAIKQGDAKKAYDKETTKKNEGWIPDDVEDTVKTLFGDQLNYAQLAQINFDHFAKDARTAYNAGHYMALKTAAAGNLETAYTMNAFADHYLGDSFASGHIRTPRRTLHGPDSYISAGWAAITGALRSIVNGKGLQGATKGVVPDLCAMLMHNEDNARGLTVKNKKGAVFKCFGDKMLYAKDNSDNLAQMREALQASADEVYEASVSKAAKKPEEGYRAWDFAPDQMTGDTHSALFKEYVPKKDGYWPVMVREPFDDLKTTKYVEVGNSYALVELYNKISKSELWKGY